MQKNGLDAMMLWVYQNLWHLSGREPMISMTGEFEDFNSEIVARLAEHLIPFVQQAAAETLIHDFERGLFDGLLAVAGKVMDTFLQA